MPKRNTKAKSKSKPKRNRTRRKVTRSQSLPAAQSSQNRSRFTTTQLSGSSVRVKGYDLVYASDEDEQITSGAFCVIPCNPAYWTGTRVARIATAYSQYRPLKFNVHYFPQVSTMTNGLITAGTLWNNDTNPEAIQQALATSNSGRIYPVYTKSTHRVNLATCLSQNLFTFSGYMTNETNPFMFLATTQSYDGAVPGYYMVEYEYDFKNPIGEGSMYEAVTKTVGDITPGDVWENTTAVLMTSSVALSIGTTLIVKLVEGAIQFFLNGSRLGMAADLVLKLFKTKSPSTQSDFDSINGNTLTEVRVSQTVDNVATTWIADGINMDTVSEIKQNDIQGMYIAGWILQVPNGIPYDGLVQTGALLWYNNKQSPTIPEGCKWYTFDARKSNQEELSYYTLIRSFNSISGINVMQSNLLLCLSPNADPMILYSNLTEYAFPIGNLFIPPPPISDKIVGKGSRIVTSKCRRPRLNCAATIKPLID